MHVDHLRPREVQHVRQDQQQTRSAHSLFLAGAPVRRDVRDFSRRELELVLVLHLAGDDVADQALERRGILAFPVVRVVTLRALASIVLV